MLCTLRFRFVFWLFYMTKGATGTGYTNVALGKPTTQVDVLYGGVSSKAVDGNKSPIWEHGSCIHTHFGPTVWWMVDLLFKYQINEIFITNRDAGERFQNFYIYVSDVNPLPIPLNNVGLIGDVCLHYTGIFPVGGPHRITCDEPVTGRYVYIYKPKNEALVICEVEIMVPSDDVRFQPEAFDLKAGERSDLSPFYSTTLEVPWILKCAAICVSRTGGAATAVQMKPSTRRCDCIEHSKLEESNGMTILDDDWDLLVAVNG